MPTCSRPPKTKKADVAERPKAFHHVGLLVNEPPGTTGFRSFQSSDNAETANRARVAAGSHPDHYGDRRGMQANSFLCTMIAKEPTGVRLEASLLHLVVQFFRPGLDGSETA